MSVITVANEKGGIGKTTTAVNLAAALSLNGNQVLLVDFDPQANATIHLGINPYKLKSSVNEAILGRRSFKAIIEPISDHLHLAPSHPSLTDGAKAIAAMPDSHTQLHYRLDEIIEFYNYIIIDCPPSMFSLSENALAAANEVLIPVNPDYLSLEGLSKFRNGIERARKAKKTKAQIAGIVITKVDGRKGITKEAIELIREQFGEMVLDTEIKINVKLEEAPSFGQHIFDYAADSVGASCYNDLAKEIMNR